MERFEVVQQIIDLFDAPSYLEVGVSHGTTFHQIRAEKKVAVDPRFQFDVSEAQKAEGPTTSYHELPSDLYFSRLTPKEPKFSVIYLDGLHTYEQTLRDLLNAVESLTPEGVIVIDDVMPNSFSASLPDWDRALDLKARLGDPDQSWMGDVYRLVFFIRDYMPAFSYASVVENHGQTVLWRARRSETESPLGLEAISRLNYADAVFQKDAFRFRPMSEILNEIGAR